VGGSLSQNDPRRTLKARPTCLLAGQVGLRG
jgi:hypothetical protein